LTKRREKMNRKILKALSLLLCAVLVFGVLPGFTVPPVEAQEYINKPVSISEAEQALTSISDLEQLYSEDNPKPISQLASVGSFELDVNEYIVSYLNSLLHPLGALDLDDAAGYVSVIVTLQELPGVLYREYSSSSSLQSVLGDTPDEIKSEAAAVSRTVSLSYPIEFSYKEIFSGFAVTVPASYAREIAKMPGVYAVTPDYTAHVLTEDASTPAQSSLAASGSQHGMAASLELLQIDELHDLGYTGAGIKVGVIDTGIDYNHPDLKDAYVSGYDFIGKDSDPMEATYEEWLEAYALDPEAYPETNAGGWNYYTEHGTHVCGTIAGTGGSGSPYSTLGIAPDVELYVGRVLGHYGTGSTSAIVAGIEDFSAEGGYLPKVDVLNASLGFNSNSAYTVDAVASNNAVIAGVSMVVATGNSASDSIPDHRSLYTLGSPASAALPIAVGATDVGGQTIGVYKNAAVYTAGGEALAADFNIVVESSGYSDSFADDVITTGGGELIAGTFGYPLYPVGDMIEATTPEELAALDDGSLNGKILVIMRGAIMVTEILSEVSRLDAAGIIIVNNQPYISKTSLTGLKPDGFPVMTATSLLADLLAENFEKELYLDLGAFSTYDRPNEIAFFSSNGPIPETAQIKPDIVAPGFAIVSTVPAGYINPDHNTTDYSYAYLSMMGTSMASPHVAGIAALMRQAFPEASPNEIKARLMNTADSDIIKASANYPAPGGSSDITQASVMEVGAGLVQPYAAIMEKTDFYAESPVVAYSDVEISSEALLTSGSITFGYVPAGSSATLPIIMHNNSDTAKQVSLTHRFILSRYSGNAVSDGLSLSFSDPGASVTVPALSEALTYVTVSVPEGLAYGTIYEGYVTLTTGSETYTLPFALTVGDSGTLNPDTMRGYISKPVITASADFAEQDLSQYLEVVFDYSGTWPNNLLLFLVEDQFGETGLMYTAYNPLAPGSSVLDENDIYLLSNLYHPWDSEAGKYAAEAVPLPDGPYTLYAAYHEYTADDQYPYYPAYELGDFLVNSTPPNLNFDEDVYIRSENGDYTVTGDASFTMDYDANAINIEYGGSLEPGDVVSVKANIYSYAIARAGLFDVMYNYDTFVSWLTGGGSELVSEPFDKSFNVLHLQRGKSIAEQHTDKDGNVWIDLKLPYAFSEEPIKIYDLSAADCSQPLLAAGGAALCNNMGKEYSISVSTDNPLEALPFEDVSVDDWFYADAQFAYAFGLMEGTSSESPSFSPRSPMTRAMVWTMLARLSGETITGETWIEAAQAWAIETGVSDGANPNGSVTRRQLATMLYRYAGGVDGWPDEAMEWVQNLGIINDGRPDDTAVRSEVAAIFHRYLENL
jgi:subtilisin family serine protease